MYDRWWVNVVVTSPLGDMPVSCLNGIPSGKLLHNDGQYPCFMGKSTISIVIFNSYFDITRGEQCRKTIKFPDSHPLGADHRHHAATLQFPRCGVGILMNGDATCSRGIRRLRWPTATTNIDFTDFHSVFPQSHSGKLKKIEHIKPSLQCGAPVW